MKAAIDEWMSKNLEDIANKLPQEVHNDPASFACGYNTGRKAVLLELDRLLDRIADEESTFPRNIEALI